MQIVSVANHKGGVGKTTSAVNIAACWGEMGQKVLLVDLDPQGSASMSFGIENDGDEILQALQKTIALPVVSTNAEGVDLVPAGPHLADARQRFSGSIGKGLLVRCLKQMQDWENVIIDCPPSLGILTMAALWASNHVIIPVEANYLAMSGLNQMVNTVESVGNDHSGIAIRAVIPCRAHPRRRVHQAIMEQFEKLFPGKVSPIVRENASLAEAPGRGQPVILTAPKSHGAEDYRQVASWLSEH
ncbi:MAG: ParA family protein [Dissulfurispiraceae bacterium]|jgi:chromosome partitioning protein